MGNALGNSCNDLTLSRVMRRRPGLACGVRSTTTKKERHIPRGVIHELKSGAIHELRCAACALPLHQTSYGYEAKDGDDNA